MGRYSLTYLLQLTCIKKSSYYGFDLRLIKNIFRSISSSPLNVAKKDINNTNHNRLSNDENKSNTVKFNLSSKQIAVTGYTETHDISDCEMVNIFHY